MSVPTAYRIVLGIYPFVPAAAAWVLVAEKHWSGAPNKKIFYNCIVALVFTYFAVFRLLSLSRWLTEEQLLDVVYYARLAAYAATTYVLFDCTRLTRARGAFRREASRLKEGAIEELRADEDIRKLEE